MIYGALDIVVGAVRSILQLITSFPMKGPNMLYDPRHYDQFLSPMYGGFSDPANVPPGSAGSSGVPPPNTGGPGGGGGHSSGSSGGGTGSSQRNPYFQSIPPVPPPPPPNLGASLGRQRSGPGGGGTGASRSQGFPISTLTSYPGSSGGGHHAGHHHHNHGHHHGHHPHQSGLISPPGLNGPNGRGYKGSAHAAAAAAAAAAALMDDPPTDLFAPDFGATFSGADAALGSGIPWSSARSYGSSRRSSASAGGGPGGAGGAGGIDLFGSPLGQDIDWLNYPG